MTQVTRCSRTHLVCVDVEDSPLSLLVWERELDFPVDPSGSDQGGVQRLDAVRGHDHFHVTPAKDNQS